MTVNKPIVVEVAYATAEHQSLIVVRLSAGSTAAMAVAAAAITDPFVAIAPLDLGIFGRPCEPQTPLSDGDRVEIYRPLNFDPMESRRRRAAKANRAKR